MAIGVLCEKRYLAQSQPSGLIRGLKDLGHEVRVIDPEGIPFTLGDDRWLDGLDLIVARGRSWGLLCLIEWAESRGVPTINKRSAISAVHNKADMAVALARAKLPTPLTFLGSTALLKESVAPANYPLILKPIFGDNCRGLQVIASPEEMQLDWPEPVALAQRYHVTDGYDLKLYGIGEDVFAVRKPSPFNKRREGEPDLSGQVELTPSLQTLGRQCGELFGLDLFGVDCIETSDGPLVIEINDFPNYTSVANADMLLARYIESCLVEVAAKK